MIGYNHRITTTLGNIVESMTFHLHNKTRRERIEHARKEIFNFEYPYWNEEHKKHFETIFLREFYFSEIASQTEGEFFFRLETWLEINMEYYIKMLQSQIWEERIENPLQNYDLDENFDSMIERMEKENMSSNVESEGTSSNNVNNEVEAESFNRDLQSQSPQNRLQITAEDGKGLIEYASGIDEQRTTSSSNQDTTSNETTQGETNQKSEAEKEGTEGTTHRLTRKGNIGTMTYNQLLNGYRQIFLRIEKEMLDELHKELFMLVY